MSSLSSLWRSCSSIADTERIYIKGYLYPILYPKISKIKKDISYPFFGAGYFEDIIS
jgi:hypothetical protein